MNIQSASISCYLPLMSTTTQQIIDKLFSDEEKSKTTYYSESDNFKLTSFDYFSIYYFGQYSDITDLKNKIFYSKYNSNSAIINSVDIINNEIIIKLSYDKFNLKFNLNEQIFELNISDSSTSYIILLNRYTSKPISLYYNRISLNDFEQNKNSGNFNIVKINSDSKYNRKDFIIIEKNKITHKKQFYFYQKT